MKSNIELIIDGGHGWETPGKRSSFTDSEGNSLLRENEFNDSMISKISFSSFEHEIGCHIVSQESHDVSLDVRVDRVNELCKKIRAKGSQPFFLSCHADAYHDASVSGSRIYYQQIVDGLDQAEAKRRFVSKEIGLKLSESFNDCVDLPKAKVMQGNYQVIRNIDCPGLLLEFAFMTNRRDLDILLDHRNRNHWTQNIVLFFKWLQF